MSIAARTTLVALRTTASTVEHAVRQLDKATAARDKHIVHAADKGAPFEDIARAAGVAVGHVQAVVGLRGQS